MATTITAAELLTLVAKLKIEDCASSHPHPPHAPTQENPVEKSVPKKLHTKLPPSFSLLLRLTIHPRPRPPDNATAYARAAEKLAALTEDKNDDAIRRRVADADATPKLGKILEAFIEGITLHDG